jgi:hypothetical protein
MKLASLMLLAFVPACSASFAQGNGTASSSAAQHQAEQGQFKSKYHAVRVDEFEVKQGVDFPAEYLKKAQRELSNSSLTLKSSTRYCRLGRNQRKPSARVWNNSQLHQEPGEALRRGFGVGLLKSCTVAFLDTATGSGFG